MKHKLLICTLLAYTISKLEVTAASSVCMWEGDYSENNRRQCGYVCREWWNRKIEPNYCGIPHYCCCKPTCANSLASSFLGIVWSQQYMKQKLSTTRQFEILKESGFKHLLIDDDKVLQTIIEVYGSEVDDVHIHLQIATSEIRSISSKASYARSYVTALKPYAHLIDTVIIGTQPLRCVSNRNWQSNDECYDMPTYVITAMQSMYAALKSKGFSNTKVTTTFDAGILRQNELQTPCNSEIQNWIRIVLLPLMRLLKQWNSPFLINIFYWRDALLNLIPTEFGIGTSKDVMVRDGPFEHFFLFDGIIESVRIALCKYGFSTLDIWVSATGWPSEIFFSKDVTSPPFLRNIVKRSKGLPLDDTDPSSLRFSGLPIPVFIYEAFDQSLKSVLLQGTIYDDNMGIFNETGYPKIATPDGKLDIGILD